MLQFHTCADSPRTIDQQVEIALKGGCGWIRLSSSDSEIISKVADRCRQSEVILIIDDDIATVETLRVHGVHLTLWDRRKIIEAREKLGPHAIIGITCKDAAELEQLRGLDVDYLTLQAPEQTDPIEFYDHFYKAFSELRPHLSDGAVAGMSIHPVASGNFPVELMPAITATGMEGIEISGNLTDIPEPEAFIHLCIATLNSNKK